MRELRTLLENVVRSEKFSVGGIVSVALAKSLAAGTSIGDYFARELTACDDLGSEGPRISVTVSGGTSHHPERVYGASGGWDKGRFVVPDGAGHWCAFDPTGLVVSDELEIILDLCCPSFRASVLLEWLIMPISHFGLASSNLTPFHASGASVPNLTNGPVVFSAWSGVGKTNLVLWALSQGGQFYGDDQVIVRSNGEICPSSRRVAIYGYNRKLAPSLRWRARTKLGIGDLIHRFARKGKGRLSLLLSYVANGLGSTRASAAELGGGAGGSCMASAHVMCHATTSSNSIRVTEASRDASAISRYSGAHVAVMEYEYIWFQRFLQTWRWAACSDLDPWANLKDRWVSNSISYFRSLDRLLVVEVPKGPGTATAKNIWNGVSAHLRQEHEVGSVRMIP